VPIRLEGEIPAEKVGLMVLHQLDEVEIEALPTNLPDELVVDATKLVELHDKITVADLVVPTGVTIITELDHPISTVVETKAMMSEEEEAAEAAEGEEGEEGAEGAEEGAEGEAKEGSEDSSKDDKKE
jgi:large subunit ribosomal protein L25